jgi:hypothetical protein
MSNHKNQQPGQNRVPPVRLLPPQAMLTQELRSEIVNTFHFNPDLDPEIEFLTPELNRERLVQILVRLRANQSPVLPPNWANPVVRPVDQGPIGNINEMDRNELIHELANRYPLNVLTLTRLTHEILASLLQNFSRNGYSRELYNAIVRNATGGRKRKSKQRRTYKRNSNRNNKYNQ